MPGSRVSESGSRVMKPVVVSSLFPLLLLASLAGDASGQRQRYSMDPGWRFTAADPVGAESPGFEDGAWRILDLPHDWSIEGVPDEQAPGGGRIGYFPTGVGWYRKHFRLPASAPGRRVWLEFDGVYMNSDVWVNGHHAGKRPYGYVSFRYDVTPYLVSGQNVVAVRVDNSAQPNSRWYTGSGIYRHVWLTAVDELHVAHWGTYVTTPAADSASATVRVRTRVENDAARRRAAVLRTLVLDGTGREVARADTSIEVPEGETVEVEQRLAVAAPRLWSVETPALYTLQAEVLDGTRVVDDQATPFGFRSIEYDSDRGFLLNGAPVKMRGVNLHHDGGAVGAAVPERVWERRLEVLKAMGVNAIRTSHNPPAPEFLDLADRMGFLVMAEAFDEWTVAKVPEGYHQYFAEWSERDLTDFIRRDRNHPSIVLWSLGNEIGEQTTADGERVLRRLIDSARRADPTRPLTTGNDQIAADPVPATPAFLNALDVVGYNYVDRWHERRELYAEQDRHDHPEWKMIGTESVAARTAFGGRLSLGDDSTVARPNYTAGTIRAEALWKWITTHEYYAGDFMWTGIDYLGETFWPGKGAAAGAIDITGFPKDAYYLYQSLWTTAPVLQLLPHWNWPGREGQVIPVIAFTNCDRVELFLNGRSLGEKRLEFPRQGTSGAWNRYERTPVNPTTLDLHLTWDVPYAPGVLRAIGTRNGETACEAEVRTAGAPAALRLRADRDTIAADPRDVAHVTFEIVDDGGTVVPTADAELRFTVEGGSILALDNGDLRDHSPYRSDRKRAFKGKGLVILRAGQPGTLRVTARAEGLPEATLRIVVRGGDPVPAIPGERGIRR